jgi:hypothetical protein
MVHKRGPKLELVSASVAAQAWFTRFNQLL